MPFPATSPRLARELLRLSAALCVLVLTAGCRSAQSAYQFRPTTAATAPAVAAAAKITGRQPSRPVPTTRPTSAARPVAVRVPDRETGKRPARRLPRLTKWPQPATRGGYTVLPSRRSPRPDGAQATAEVGLGTTVLGVLGLLVAPLALVGLLIWGGPGWAILAGLAGLAVLVAYLDPFR